MAHRGAFVVGLVLALAFNFVQCSSNNIESNIEVMVVSDLTKFLSENPDIKYQPLIKEIKAEGPSNVMQMSYKIDRRINGDHLLATDSNSQRWTSPHDVKTNLHYPQNGIGAVITYLEIIVDQSTNLGQAVVVSGGIGQRQIAVAIEARQTLYFSYRASIFGY